MIKEPYKLEILIGEIIFGVLVISTIVFFVRRYLKQKAIDEGASQVSDTLADAQNKPQTHKEAVDSHKFDYDRVAKLIYNAHSLLSDNENDVYSAFNMIKTKDQLKYLLLYFKKYMNYDMYEYLSSFLNEEELSKVYDIVKKIK